MGERYVQKLAYSYDFKSGDMKPLLEAHILLEKDDVLAFFKEKNISEPLEKKVKDEAVSLAEVQDDVSEANVVSSSPQTTAEAEGSESKGYALTYYNPETGKSEVLAVTSNIKIKDYTKKVVEEAVGMKSAYPLYSYIVTPVIAKEINPYILQEIRDNAEYMTPPKFGGVAIVRKKAEVQSHVVKVSQKGTARSLSSNQISQIIDTHEVAHTAVAEAMKRKDVTEQRIGEEIVLLEKAVDDLQHERSAEQVIERLPALSRVRFLAALRKKKISQSSLLALLEKDVSFLQNIKKKLRSLSLAELLDLARTIKKLKEKE